MSLCETCRAPGSCCSGFELSDQRGQLTFWDSDTREQINADVSAKALPFRSIAKRETYTDGMGRAYSTWYFGCTLLGFDGRCTDYENRPQLCQDYQPGQDELCAEYVLELKGIPIRVQSATQAV